MVLPACLGCLHAYAVSRGTMFVNDCDPLSKPINKCPIFRVLGHHGLLWANGSEYEAAAWVENCAFVQFEPTKELVDKSHYANYGPDAA